MYKKNFTAWSVDRDPLTEMKVDTLRLPWEDSIPHSETPYVDTHTNTHARTHAHTHTHTHTTVDTSKPGRDPFHFLKRAYTKNLILGNMSPTSRWISAPWSLYWDGSQSRHHEPCFELDLRHGRWISISAPLALHWDGYPLIPHRREMCSGLRVTQGVPVYPVDLWWNLLLPVQVI